MLEALDALRRQLNVNQADGARLVLSAALRRITELDGDHPAVSRGAVIDEVLDAERLRPKELERLVGAQVVVGIEGDRVDLAREVEDLRHSIQARPRYYHAGLDSRRIVRLG